MAATVSPWAKPGAWALDAEEQEAELKQQSQLTSNNSGTAATTDFPPLSAAASTKQKKKNQTLSLAEFSSLSSAQPSPQPVGRTHEDLLLLPTGPRQRESGPSRADETDNWVSGKKSFTGNGFDRRDGGERRERGGFFDSQSKADEVDSWVSNKSFAPSEGRRFGGGFERRGSFDSLSIGGGGGGADSDSWGKKKTSEESSGGGGGGGGSGGMRPKLVLQPRTLPVAKEGGEGGGVGVRVKAAGANPFGEARPREEVLAEKGMDWKETEEKFKATKFVGKEERAAEGRRGFGSAWTDNKTERTWRK
ncbi:eIF-4B domain-containing protein, partial [Cephalotus follicularis]